MRRAERASLATILTGDDSPARGWPYASLVLVAHDQDASPLLLLSDLADHTKNLKADSRVALLYDATAGLADPLAGARASVLGRAGAVEDAERERLLARYLSRQPGAAVYAGFKDFKLYKVAIERAHLVAGFGRIHWVEGEAIRLRAEARALAEAEPGIVAHMNEDHADAIRLYAERLLGQPAGEWRMTGVDPEGCDLLRERDFARLDFGGLVTDAETCRAELVRLVKQARAVPAP